MGYLVTQGDKPCFVTLAVFLFVWLLYLCLGYCTIEFFLPLLVVKRSFEVLLSQQSHTNS